MGQNEITRPCKAIDSLHSQNPGKKKPRLNGLTEGMLTCSRSHLGVGGRRVVGGGVMVCIWVRPGGDS